MGLSDYLELEVVTKSHGPPSRDLPYQRTRDLTLLRCNLPSERLRGREERRSLAELRK